MNNFLENLSSVGVIGNLRVLTLVEYEDALQMLQDLVFYRQENVINDHLIFATHNHIYTMGKRSKKEHILIDESMQKQLGIKIFETVRGGDVTYHGPGQMVAYPVLQLPPKRQDVVRYVRDLEEVMIKTLFDFGINANRVDGLSGAWIGDAKIGAVGVRMSRWVTSHGIAINVNTDLNYFSHIVPCGIRDHGVTSMSKILGQTIDIADVQESFKRHFEGIFDIFFELTPLLMHSVQVFIYRTIPSLQILCLHRTQNQGGFWQPVTGKIDLNERPEETAIREVYEETGLRGSLLNLNYEHQFLLDKNVFPHIAQPAFVCEHSFALSVDEFIKNDNPNIILDSSSHSEFKWLSPIKALDMFKWAGNKVGLERLINILS